MTNDWFSGNKAQNIRFKAGAMIPRFLFVALFSPNTLINNI